MNKVIIFKQEVGCNPCNTLSLILENELEATADKTVYLDKMIVVDGQGKETGENAIALAQQYGVMAVPVLILADEEGKAIKDLRGLAQIQPQLEDVFAQRG